MIKKLKKYFNKKKRVNLLKHEARTNTKNCITSKTHFHIKPCVSQVYVVICDLFAEFSDDIFHANNDATGIQPMCMVADFRSRDAK